MFPKRPIIHFSHIPTSILFDFVLPQVVHRIDAEHFAQYMRQLLTEEEVRSSHSNQTL